VIQLWARTHGLRDDAITYVNAGGAAERLAALDAGAIDLVPLDPPEVIAAQKRGYQRIADLTQETIPWQADGLTVPEKHLQADPALARAIVQAVAEAVYLLRGDRERFQAALTQYTKIEDPDALAAAYAAWVRRVKAHGRPDAAWVQSVQQVVDETMAGTAQQPTTRFLDLSVLDGLEQDRFFDRLEQQYPVPADARP